MMDYPLVVFVVALVVLRMAAQVGAVFRARQKPELDQGQLKDLGVILSSALTLLALITGFTFSMATARYDQRKNYEAEEANAIGTDYARVDFLAPGDTAKLHDLLRKYTDQRILFYTTRADRQLEQINASTVQLQTDMWSLVRATAPAQPGPIAGLSISGMNDVLNSQAYAQAAWWNRIPTGAWALMAFIAIFCNFLFGFSTHAVGEKAKRFFVLPLITSIAFFLIADIDSPRGGVIRMRPQNLEALSHSLQAHGSVASPAR